MKRDVLFTFIQKFPIARIMITKIKFAHFAEHVALRKESLNLVGAYNYSRCKSKFMICSMIKIFSTIYNRQ